jgi:hypothetical protein
MDILCILTYHPEEDVSVLVRTPRNSLDDKYAALLDGLWMAISNQQRVTESCWPITGQVITHSVCVLKVEQPLAHSFVEQIAEPNAVTLGWPIGDAKLMSQRIVGSALTSFAEDQDKQISQ